MTTITLITNNTTTTNTTTPTATTTTNEIIKSTLAITNIAFILPQLLIPTPSRRL